MLHSSTPKNPNCQALELCKILGPLETILRDPYDKCPLLAVARVYLLVLTDILRHWTRKWKLLYSIWWFYGKWGSELIGTSTFGVQGPK